MQRIHRLQLSRINNNDDDRPLSEILEELAQRGISFKPTATREDLEDLLIESKIVYR